MSAKTNLKELLDRFRGLKQVDYTNSEIEKFSASDPRRFVSNVRVTLRHGQDSKSFEQTGLEFPTIKQAERSAAQELLKIHGTEVEHYCSIKNWEASEVSTQENSGHPTSTSTVHVKGPSNLFEMAELSSADHTFVSSSPRTPNGSRPDVLYYETTTCAPFVSTVTAISLSSGSTSSKKLVVEGNPSLSRADAEISAHNKLAIAYFAGTFQNPATSAPRNVAQQQSLFVPSITNDNCSPYNETVHMERLPSSDASSSIVSLPLLGPSLFNPVPITPSIPTLRERIESTASVSLVDYFALIPCLLSTDQQCRLDMWLPENKLGKEISRDVILIMHTLFPNPVLANEVWTLMDKRFTLSESAVGELRLKEATNRSFLVRYILLLHRNLTVREKQRNILPEEQHPWQLPLACALCHGGRILTEVVGGHALTLLSILFHGEPGQALGMIKRRWSSHQLSFVKEGFYKEKKACHYAQTYGLNVSFGGLGNQYGREKKFIGPEGVGIEREEHATKWMVSRLHPQQGHVLIKWHESVTGNHVPKSSLLIGIENVDYTFRHGYFGAGHSLFGCSGAKSVSNGDKLSCVFEKQNSEKQNSGLDGKSVTPSKLGGLRVSFPAKEFSKFQDYCAKYLALDTEEQMYLMLAILTNELNSDIELDVLGEKHVSYPRLAAV